MAEGSIPTYGPDNVGAFMTLTWTNLMKGIVDNIFSENTFLGEVKKMFMKEHEGGNGVSEGVMYGYRPAEAYARYGVLDITPDDGLTRDNWNWARYHKSVVFDGFSERTNKGPAALAPVVATKKRQAEESLKALLEADFFATSQASNKIVPLPLMVLGSGSVGDINGSTATWWASTVTSSGAWLSKGRADLTSLINTLAKLNPVGDPTLIVSDKTSYEAYEESLPAGYQYADLNKADTGRKAKLTFKGIPWSWSGQANSGVVYVLAGSPAFEFAVHSGTNFLNTPFQRAIDQDAYVSQILLACATLTHNRRKLGKLTGVTA